MDNEWSVLLLSLLTILTPWIAPHSSKRDLPESGGSRTCSKSYRDAHGNSHIISTKKSFLPPRCWWLRKHLCSSAFREKTICTTPLDKFYNMTLLPPIATRLSAFLNVDRAGRNSRAAQGLAAHSSVTSSQAGKQMPDSQCTSGTSGVQKLHFRQT